MKKDETHLTNETQHENWAWAWGLGWGAHQADRSHYLR